MFFFVREGKYVTPANKFWFWLSVLAALCGAGMGFILLMRAGQMPLAVILALLYLGCAVYDCVFLSTGKRSCAFLACGFGIAGIVIPFILQCINLQSDSYFPLSGFGVMTVISCIWALVGSKKLCQKQDETLKTCLTLRGMNSRIPMAVLYVLTAAGIILSLIAVISGSLPVYP